MALSIGTLLDGSSSRDYSLVGPEAANAKANGLVDAGWFLPPIAPERMNELTNKNTTRPVVEAIAWIALIVGFGTAAVLSVGNWWAIPLFLVYGALYGGAADSRWHEFGHGTATDHERFNQSMYLLASFLLWRGPTLWRWSHFRHHSDTIIVGRDPEIQVARPPTIRRFVLNYTNLVNGPRMLLRHVRHAAGRVDAEALDFVPAAEVPKMVWESRVFVAILTGAVAVSVATTSFVPVLLVGLPTIYGGWLVVFFGATQHLGLREDVLDHRANSRTIYLNPVFRFLYLNMNYHIEHHMFPSVPYYRLPALHAEIKHALPEPCPNMASAYREMIGELLRQRRDANHELSDRLLPDVAGATGRPSGLLATRGGDGSFDFGALDTLSANSINRVDADGRTFAVVQLEPGEVYIVDGMCTHGQAHLADGVVVDGLIECPKHNGRFDPLTGEPCRKPVRIPLQTYPVTINHGRIVSSLASRTDESIGSASG